MRHFNELLVLRFVLSFHKLRKNRCAISTESHAKRRRYKELYPLSQRTNQITKNSLRTHKLKCSEVLDYKLKDIIEVFQALEM